MCKTQGLTARHQQTPHAWPGASQLLEVLSMHGCGTLHQITKVKVKRVSTSLKTQKESILISSRETVNSDIDCDRCGLGRWHSRQKSAGHQARGPEFDSQKPYGDRREATSESCPLAFMGVSWHKCSYTQTHNRNKWIK